MVSDKKLDFWIKNDLNVLFIGEHGVGKTTCVIDSFKRNNLKYLYFSASTMDPWVDFIGVPKEQKDENGNSYLELVRPKAFQDDSVEAIFMDEYNRSGRKVRNAVMELIQFKSINGKKFKNLKIVWAAVNPDDNTEDSEDTMEYDVEKLDPAQKDRFQVHVKIPYKPSVSYFKNKYGDIGEYACEWWDELPRKIKRDVSPRRLDYAMDLYKKNGDLRDVLPEESNIIKLITLLSNGSVKKTLQNLYKNKNPEAIRDFFKVENNYKSAEEYFLKNKEYVIAFLPFFDKEKIASLIAGNNTIRKIVFNMTKNCDQIVIDVIKDIVTANTNSKLVRQIKSSSFFKKYCSIKIAEDNIDNITITKYDKSMIKIAIMPDSKFDPELAKWSNIISGTITGGTYYRRKTVDFLYNNRSNVLTKETAYRILDTLQCITDRTQLNSYGDYLYKTVTKIASYYIHYLVNTLKEDFSSIYKKYSNDHMKRGVLKNIVKLYCTTKTI